MSDDLDRRLRESLGEIELPAAPATLRTAMNRLVAEPVAPRTRARRLIPAAVAVLVVASAATAVLIGGSSLPHIGVSSSPKASQPPGSYQPASAAAATQSPPATPAASSVLSASDNGLSMTVTPANPSVEPGGSVTVTVTIHNGRSGPVVLQTQRCGAPALMSFMLPFPVDPAGRVWTGIAGEYKTFALGQAERSGGFLQPWYADAKPCSEDNGWVLTIQPGETSRASLVWTAELVEGVPALPRDLDFTVTVGHDPTCTPPPGRTCGPVGSTGGTALSWPWTFEDMTASGGVLRIAGDAPKVVTAGQAIDALLSNQRFTNWLTEQPASTWSVANVLLQNPGKAQGIVPAGPSWEVGLFREVGVQEEWAIGYVDPFSGKVLSLSFCYPPSQSGPGGSCVSS
jgi:hypothetical protein